MSKVTWKPVLATAWNGLCAGSCSDATMAAVALVDSGAMYCFVSEALVAKFGLPVKPGVGMDITLADRSQVLALQTCLVPLVVCSAHCQALHCVVECRVLPQLNHDIVLGIDWLQATNPVIDW